MHALSDTGMWHKQSSQTVWEFTVKITLAFPDSLEDTFDTLLKRSQEKLQHNS